MDEIQYIHGIPVGIWILGFAIWLIVALSVVGSKIIWWFYKR